jgi:hypothetical protein
LLLSWHIAALLLAVGWEALRCEREMECQGPTPEFWRGCFGWESCLRVALGLKSAHTCKLGNQVFGAS